MFRHSLLVITDSLRSKPVILDALSFIVLTLTPRSIDSNLWQEEVILYSFRAMIS